MVFYMLNDQEIGIQLYLLYDNSFHSVFPLILPTLLRYLHFFRNKLLLEQCLYFTGLLIQPMPKLTIIVTAVGSW